MPSRSPSLPIPRCFHLHWGPRQAASRCFEGAEEVLSFVGNSRGEDSLAHVILIFLHPEFGVELLAHFPSPVWGHFTGVGRWGNPWGWDGMKKLPKYLPQLGLP